MAISNSASPEIIWGLGGPKEDHQLHHCCWTGRVEEEERWSYVSLIDPKYVVLTDPKWTKKCCIIDKEHWSSFRDNYWTLDPHVNFSSEVVSTACAFPISSNQGGKTRVIKWLIMHWTTNIERTRNAFPCLCLTYRKKTLYQALNYCCKYVSLSISHVGQLAFLLQIMAWSLYCTLYTPYLWVALVIRTCKDI